MAYTRHEHIKTDGRRLWLYSRKPRDYVITNDLPPLDTAPKPIVRMHPFRGEPVYMNPGRNVRTLNPPADYNPLGAVKPGGFPGEIPVSDFEVAVFENRWPSLIDTGPASGAYGRCEVVVYSPNDSGSLGDIRADQVALLIEAVGDRVDRIFADPEIAAVLPFENRGAFTGTTLPHPHGQIYALGTCPEVLSRQSDNAIKNNILSVVLDKLDEVFVVEDTDHTRTLVPPFARYPFETWVVPKSGAPVPSALAPAALLDFAAALRRQVRRLDGLFSTPAPYSMWHAIGPRGASHWPYHVQFWPLQRGEGKMKYLASVEQIAQTFLQDVMPEDAAAQLRAVPMEAP